MIKKSPSFRTGNEGLSFVCPKLKALSDVLLKNVDNGGFIMMAESNEGFLPYTQKNAVNVGGAKRTFKLDNGKGHNYCTVDQCFKPGVIAYFKDGTITGDVPEAMLKTLERALAKNALTADHFVPGAGFTFFHSVGDEVVPYCNLESVRNTWGTQTCKYVTYKSNTTLHVSTDASFLASYCGNLVGEILNDKWQPSNETMKGILW